MKGPNPSGLCMCGCGQPTPPCTRNNRYWGWVKGEPMRFIPGHHARLRRKPLPDDSGPNPSGLCMCGCGTRTKLARQTDPAKQMVRGRPLRYVAGHHHEALKKSRTAYEVDPTTGCWNWLRSKDRHGYGRMWSGSRTCLAHRWYYEQRYGGIPEGLYACHKCDNPGCVNPDHMFLGTQSDNMRDCRDKGRLRNARAARLAEERGAA